MQQTLVSPVDIFSVTMAVTSWPVWVTPSATTPLSAHITTTARLPRSTLGLPVMPAMRMTASSRRPRLLSGWATASQWVLAADMAARSAGVMDETTSERVSIRITPLFLIDLRGEAAAEKTADDL